MIVQAAIRLDGKVYTGRRHNNILHDAAIKYGLGFGGLRLGEQGFVDDTGAFLNREEARAHFVACGQVPAKGKILSDTRLDSSDLY
jgi:hypothetical protein